MNRKFTGSTDYTTTANRVSVLTIIVNIILSLGKLVCGIVANSSAMVSDAIHSASDVFSTVVVMIGIRLSAKEADREHPYGHERIECAAAIILAVILLFTGFGIGIDAAKSIIWGESAELKVPGTAALVAALVSIVVKEAMYWYTRHYAKRLDSGALMADAWHHRSDAMSSVGALIGIGGAMLGFPIMDPLASIVIFVFIAKAAYDIFMDAINKMVDRACDEETEKRLAECVLRNKDVIGIDLLKTRIFASKIYVDIEISANGSCTLEEAHAIAYDVHNDIETTFPNVKHIMVHVNPCKK